MTSARWFTGCATASLLWACSGGAGTPLPLPTGRESPGTSGTPESPGTSGSREPAPGGPESPSSGSPGASGSSSGTASGGCLPCNETFSCSNSEDDGGTFELTFELTFDSQCQLVGAQFELLCDGTIDEDANVLGSWAADGSGNLFLTAYGTTSACTPTSALLTGG